MKNTLKHLVTSIRLGLCIYLISLPANAWGIKADSLSEAILINKPKQVKVFIDKGADVNVQDEDGFTPLMSATLTTQMEIIEMLLENGADISLKDSDGGIAFDMVLGYDQPIDRKLMNLFFRYGQDTNSLNSEGLNLIQQRIQWHDTDASLVSDIKYLLDKGVKVDHRLGNEETVIWSVCQLEHDDDFKTVIDLLLDKGADINAKDHEGDTLLALRGCHEHQELKEYLISKGASES